MSSSIYSENTSDAFEALISLIYMYYSMYSVEKSLISSLMCSISWSDKCGNMSSPFHLNYLLYLQISPEKKSNHL